MMFDVGVNIVLLCIDTAVLFAISKRINLATIPRVAAAVVIAPILLVAALFILGLFGTMRVCAWAIFVHLVILLAGDAVLRWKDLRKWAIASAAAALLIAGVGVDAFFIEPHWLEVTRHRIVSTKVKRPFKIAIIADLQTDGIAEYERSALKRATDEKPDLVLFAGDYVQEHDDTRRHELIRDLRDSLRELKFKSAIAVEGNCDHDDWPEIFEGTGVKCTRETRTYSHEDFQITALSLNDSEYQPSAKRPEGFHIMLGHMPNFALSDMSADLLIAGHTHGGQVRLPFIGPLMTLSSVPRSWAAGMTDLGGGRTLIVSRGIGMERGNAPRLRFLCRPELVIVDVVPAP